MAEVEQLSILIDVIDDFDDELDRLLFKLGEVQTAVEAVDPVTIDVDVRGEHELDALITQLGMLEGMDMGDMGDIVLGEKRVDRSTRGGMTSMRGVESRLDDLISEIGSIEVGGGGGGTSVEFEDEGSMREQLNILTQQLKGVQNSFDGVSDNFDGLGKSVGRTADAADDAADGFLQTNLRMSDLHNAVARAVPLLVIFVGTLPAIISGVVALAGAAVAAAAALSALTVFGAIAFAQEIGGGNISEGFLELARQVRDDFLNAFSPLFDQLAPVFERGIDGLERLFQAIASEGDALVGLVDEAEGVGQFLIQTLPSFLRDVALFADAASDALGAIINRVGNFDVFEILSNIIVATLPELMVFFGLLADMIGPLIRLSIGFLQVANGVLFLVNGMLTLIDIIPFLNEQAIGVLVSGLLAAYSAVLLFNSALIASSGTALVSMGRSIIGLVANLAGYVGVSGSAIASTLGLAASMKILAAAIALTGIGALAVIFGAIAGQAATAATNIDSATSSLKDFQSQQQSMSQSGVNPYRDPNITGSEGTGSSRFSGNNVTVNIEGDADEETVRTQVDNAMFRMNRTGGI